MIRINFGKKAIEISKDFAKKSAIYGSNEYNELKAAKADFPTFRVSVKQGTRRAFEDRITTNDMMLYIEKHSGKESAEMERFLELRGKTIKDTDNRCETVETAKLAEIKAWFFLTYPEVNNSISKNRRSRIDQILAEAAKRAEAANENNAASA